MIIYNFNIIGMSIFPHETDTPLIVNAYAVLPLAVTRKGFQHIRWRDSQI